jgi:transketolase
MRKTCLNQIYKLAKKDKRIVFIGSDLGAGTLSNFQKEMPDRFFMEGIMEQHVIGMAAGMAKEGKIVYVNTIATFITRRCFEQNVLDLGLHKLNVRLIGMGGGVVYAPLGPTHLAIDDIAIMRSIPNMTVCVPSDAVEMEKLMTETPDYPGPIYIRVAKGGDELVFPKNMKYRIGKAYTIEHGKDVLIITTGITLGLALRAKDELKNKSLKARILHIPTIKPIDKKSIVQCIKNAKVIITIEEHSIIGGLGSAIAEILADANFKDVKRFKRIALPDLFPEGYGSQTSMLGKYGITKENLVSSIKNFFDY